MKWLVDIDTAVSDGLINADAATQLKQRSRDALVNYVINLALFAGVAMVIGGAAFWLEDRWALAALGAALAGAGALTLLRGGFRIRLVANASAFIGAALAVGAFAHLLFDGRTDRVGVGIALGLPTAALGWWLRRVFPNSLSSLGGWMLLLGAGVHLTGVLFTERDLGLQWLVLHYVGFIAVACGVMLDVRFVTALAIVPLAAALSSRTFYSHASYGVAIYESTLTIVQMGLLAALAIGLSLRFKERTARHARTLGKLALIWANMAFWIGSLWGDVVGFHLWGPDWDTATSGAEDWQTKAESWRIATETFNAHALTISANSFALVLAVGILAVGAWAAITARRAVLNIAVTFGAIHFLTQYFERLEATPEVMIIAGVIAILGAWGIWSFNRRLTARQ